MNKKYQVIRFNKSHVPKIKDLYHLAYKRKKSLKNFNYKLERTPNGSPIGYLMKYGKTIVGFYVIIPIIIKLKNRNVLGGLSFLTMTHPEHQRKGIFRKLAKKTFSAAKKKGYKFIVGYSANENSIEGFRKLGFFSGPIYLRNICLDKKNLKKYPISYKNRFPEEIGKMWEDFEEKNQFNIRLFKNKEYFEWRYKKNPANYYTIFEKGKYFIIVKKYNNTLNIIDFFGNILNLSEVIIDIAIQEAKKLKCDEVTIWWPNIKNLKIEKNLLRQIKTTNYFVIKKLDHNITSEILESKNWYFTMGDSDVF
ncbi:MAG: GNAT family N-acetyltransferase [Candidatus Nitrosopumilus sp. bin_7KS]